MPLETREYDLDATIDRLDEERRSKAEEQAQYPSDSRAAQQLASEGQRADRYLTGLTWLRDTHDVETITLSALTNGERRRVSHTAEESAIDRSDIYVAAGTYDAPWLEHDPEAVTQGDFEETIAEIPDLHPALVDWAEQRIGELSKVGDDEGKSYRALVREQRIQATSTEQSG